MSISAPQVCRHRRNSGAEIDIPATSTSFRHVSDKSFLTGAVRCCAGGGSDSRWLTGAAPRLPDPPAFLATSDVNFVLVNWTSIDTIFYPSARNHVPRIAQRVAYLLDFLRVVYGVPLSSVHVVGHSLGAHIAGQAGSKVQWGRVGRITGMWVKVPGHSKAGQGHGVTVKRDKVTGLQ